MTVQRSHRLVEFHCDGKSCHEIFETGTAEFGEAIADFRRSDWQVRKTGDTYLHLCPDCVEAERPGL